MSSNLGELMMSGVAGGILATIISLFVNRKKLGADTAAVLSETAMELLPPLRSEIKELRAEIVELRARVRETTDELETCRAGRRAADIDLEATRERERAKDDLIAALTREQPQN